MQLTHIAQKLGTVVGAAALMTSGTFAVDAPAKAAGPNSVAAVCGYYPMGMYRHCDAGSGSWVSVDAQDFWGGIHEVWVHPGINDLQPGIRWRVVDAWWNGGVFWPK